MISDGIVSSSGNGKFVAVPLDEAIRNIQRQLDQLTHTDDLAFSLELMNGVLI